MNPRDRPPGPCHGRGRRQRCNFARPRGSAAHECQRRREARREFHRDAPVRGPRPRRLRRPRGDLRLDRRARTAPGRRRRRQQAEPAGCDAADRRATIRAAPARAHRDRAGRVLALAARPGAHRPHARVRRAQQARPSRRGGQLPRLRSLLRARDLGPARDGRQLVRADEADHRGRARVAGRARARRRRRAALHRDRPVPGVSRAEQEVSQLLEDRADVAADAQGLHPDRHRGPRCPRCRVRADRHLRAQGRDRLHPARCGRYRRRAGAAHAARLRHHRPADRGRRA